MATAANAIAGFGTQVVMTGAPNSTSFAAWLLTLPTTPQTQGSGLPWNDGGVLAIS